MREDLSVRPATFVAGGGPLIVAQPGADALRLGDQHLNAVRQLVFRRHGVAPVARELLVGLMLVAESVGNKSVRRTMFQSAEMGTITPLASEARARGDSLHRRAAASGMRRL